MTEVEQLRKEVNELRERLARLEARPQPVPLDLMRFGPRQAPQPVYVDPTSPAWRPPYEITCAQNAGMGVNPAATVV